MRPPAVIRYRCLLCKPARWKFGTWADWQYHYTVLHTDHLEPKD